MPTFIPMLNIMMAGHNLGFRKVLHSEGNQRIEIALDGNTMRIYENRMQVFSMRKVQVAGEELVIDHPKKEPGQSGRQWGILGMLIGLYYGRAQGCTTVFIPSPIEVGSLAYWAKFGLREGKTNLMFALGRGVEWVLGNNPQEHKEVTTFYLQ